jgi:hypothetical protein
MTLEQFLILTKPFIEEFNQFTIQLHSINDTNGRSYYNNSVNENVKPNYGIYAVCDTSDNSVIYIGKGGTIKNNGVFGNQNLNGRLKAPRGVYNSSYEYFKKVMNDNSMENLTFLVVYSNSDNPPAYIEAVALLDYYNQNSTLPLLNNEF